MYVHVLLTLINASVSKRSYLVLCLSSTARTEERAEGGDMRFSQKHLVLHRNPNVAFAFLVTLLIWSDH